MDKKQVIAAFKKKPGAQIGKTKLSYDKAELLGGKFNCIEFG
jgi:hypothetical protein